MCEEEPGETATIKSFFYQLNGKFIYLSLNMSEGLRVKKDERFGRWVWGQGTHGRESQRSLSRWLCWLYTEH